MVVTESRSDGIPQQLSEGVKLAEEKYRSEMKLNVEIVELERESEDESYNHGEWFGEGYQVIMVRVDCHHTPPFRFWVFDSHSWFKSFA